MPAKYVVGGLGGLVVAIASGLAITNPSSETFERYAADRLAEYLKSDTCRQAYGLVPQVPPLLSTAGCQGLVNLGKPGLQLTIRRMTTRKNYVLFSIYHTRIGPTDTLPSYQQTTLALANQFIRLQHGWYLGDRPLTERSTLRPTSHAD